jgi:hypothetical protein
MSHGGKGDDPRPLGVTREEFNNKFETIFGKKQPKAPYVYVPPELNEETLSEVKDSEQGG